MSACEEQVCKCIDSNQQHTDIRWQVSNGVVRGVGGGGGGGGGVENLVGVFAPGANGMSSLTFDKQTTVTLGSSIRKGDLISQEFLSSTDLPDIYELSRFSPQEFLAAFTNQNSTYFIVQIVT